MKFKIDNQTFKDLDIFDTAQNGQSVFALFNFTQCLGGKERLRSFLSSPVTDLTELTERKAAIAYFQKYLPIGLEVDKNSLDFTEFYLKNGSYPTRIVSKAIAIERKIMDKISPNSEYYLIEKGVSSTVNLLKSIHQFSLELSAKFQQSESYPTLLQKNNEKVLEIFSQPEYEEIINLKKIKAYDTSRLDYLFRYKDRHHIRFFLSLIYEYDAFRSVAKAAGEYKLSYPEILPETENRLNIEGLFHPFVENAIPNDIHFDGSSNLLFVSGPNMAGKSTFLKALGICVYLAHVGFPVPASRMTLSVLSGLCTTINIADNLKSGYSHFYAEVMRIKDVTAELSSNKNMLVIFDELFRGTNVKDAYDGTLAIVSAFSRIKSSFFVVSTHIVEVAKELDDNTKIKFCYFEVDQPDGIPTYTYKLKEGVSDVRLGMYIINKERLIEQINSITDDK
ncbi:MutS-related protein [Dysgonomonas sp. ZJ279]|uniref:MutS-related protein n=1 Tax=Dysgonomonas sp. ZJ279 TaxID=2709796 RepID=UPI0013ED3092|nr:hypothetical protein [Dysgonomonas sp. ZJ279]